MTPIKIDIHALENIHFAGEKMNAKDLIKIFEDQGYLILNGKHEQKFIKGEWYVHEESPGFLIRVDNPEKSICSGWTGSDRAFQYHYTYLSKTRLRLATPIDVLFKVNVENFDLNEKLTEKLNQDLQPIRLGRKQQRAVLDDRNFAHEVCIFNPKYMHFAPAVVDFLNQIK